MRNSIFHNVKKILKCGLSKGLKPRVATFLITYRCNCRCQMCIIPAIPCGKELDIPEIRRVFREIGPLRVVRLSGGEPFLRVDIAEAINTIDSVSRPSMIIISTNALLGGRIIETLSRLDHPEKVHFEISIDGVDDVHDRIRGKKGAFKSVMDTISLLVPLARRLHFTITASQVIADLAGFDHYWKLRAILDPLGVDIFPVIAYEPSTALYSGTQTISAPRAAFPYDENFKRELHAFAAGLLMNFPRRNLSVSISKRYYLLGIRNRIVHARSSPNPPCTALHRHIRINPDGDVPVCMHNSHSIGNLSASPYKTVWHCEKAEMQRLWVNRCQGCWAGCEIIPSAVYSGDIVKGFAFFPRGRQKSRKV